MVRFIPNRLEFHFNWIEIEPIIWPYRVSMSHDSRNVGLEASDWLITNLGSYISDTQITVIYTSLSHQLSGDQNLWPLIILTVPHNKWIMNKERLR